MNHITLVNATNRNKAAEAGNMTITPGTEYFLNGDFFTVSRIDGDEIWAICDSGTKERFFPRWIFISLATGSFGAVNFK